MITWKEYWDNQRREEIMAINQQGILFDIIDERKRQDEKWGDQSVKNNYIWLAILMEEIGEISEAILKEVNWLDGRKELIQIAAVAVAWIEKLDKEHGQKSKFGTEPLKIPYTKKEDDHVENQRKYQ